MFHRSFIILLCLVVLYSACTVDAPLKSEDELLVEELLSVPEGFPDIPFPEDNELTADRWWLGKKLFFDPMMSIDNSIHCGSCHKQELAFADELIISPGVENRLGSRNAPSLANVAFLPHLLREGGVPTLEQQVLVPIQEHEEFDNNILVIAERMNEIESYVSASEKAYGRSPDPFVITRALSTFQRTIISGESAYDEYAFQSNSSALTAQELRGMDLFFSADLACASCHGDILFTDHSFQNNGLYEVYEDDGRFLLTLEESDRALFRVPSLRNVGLTAPYMHDGSMASLEEVIEHYNSGGENHPNKNPLIKALGLDDSEKEDLIAFLNSLSDYKLLSNPLYMPE